MQRLRKDLIYFVLSLVPITFFGVLWFYAIFRYGSYYDNWSQTPFHASSLFLGCFLSLGAVGLAYMMSETRVKKVKEKIETEKEKLRRQEKDSQRLIEVERKNLAKQRQAYQNLIASFLTARDLTSLLNSDLLTKLHHPDDLIENVEVLSGGYSGASVYLIKRYKDSIPYVLKVAELAEVVNEAKKFHDYVKGKLINVPKICKQYLDWGGNYGGIEYDLNWAHIEADHLTFFDIYRECLSQDRRLVVEEDTLIQIITRLFDEIKGVKKWGWNSKVILERNLPSINIYEEHYPFAASKIDVKVYPKFTEIKQWGQESLKNLEKYFWDMEKLNSHLHLSEWVRRKSDVRFLFLIAKTVIHGDLNSRNILVEVNRENHNIVNAVGLIDFSHTGNGLTRQRTDQFLQQNISLAEDIGSLANDFCRLEADIKFCLTDLNDEQDLRQAWLLECLLLKYHLSLPDWERLPLGVLEKVMEEYNLPINANWQNLIDRDCWLEVKSRKFIVAWQSIKTIRAILKSILPPNYQSKRPFLMALLQASLSMIYYEDERFHNPNLQKLYLIFASELLCRELDKTALS
ncbi:MAG: hypothetical protein KDJ52_17910 [Anaerolineae bacterium]|nr:hypothetical protein [Anaerolineae bacterium]